MLHRTEHSGSSTNGSESADDATTAAHLSARSVEPWTRLGCSRCPYRWEHPGPPEPGDLERVCGVCGSPLGAVTVFRALEAKTAPQGFLGGR